MPPRSPTDRAMNLSGLITGLGNPGKKYEATRHNLGFAVVDELMAAMDSLNLHELKRDKKFDLWRGPVSRGRTPFLLLKPMTYMNLSGEAVGHVASYYRIEPEEIIVIHDELDLPLGTLRWKFGGGTAGHNGLKSIVQHLGTKDFHRLRVGIGKPKMPSGAQADGKTTGHVLGTFRENERSMVEEILKAAAHAVRVFDAEGRDAAGRFVNGFTPTALQTPPEETEPNNDSE